MLATNWSVGAFRDGVGLVRRSVDKPGENVTGTLVGGAGVLRRAAKRRGVGTFEA